MLSPDLPDLLTVVELAELLRLSESSVRNRLSRGTIPGIVRLGERTIRIRTAAIRTWLEENASESALAEGGL